MTRSTPGAPAQGGSNTPSPQARISRFLEQRLTLRQRAWAVMAMIPVLCLLSVFPVMWFGASGWPTRERTLLALVASALLSLVMMVLFWRANGSAFRKHP